MIKTNISEYLPEVAGNFPNKRAIIYPQSRDRLGRVCYSHLTFKQLNDLSDRYAYYFQNKGIKKGTKVVMLLKPSLDFIAAVFAVFKTGAVPVLIDPGMGRKNLLGCIKQTQPEAMIAISPVHWVGQLFKGSLSSIKTVFSFGKCAPPWAYKLEEAPATTKAFCIVDTKPDDHAAILFTTGSTGPPKGVIYTHNIFITQTELIRETYGAGPEEMDMPGFPLFALFSSALGMSCVIPDMDPTRPANVDPVKIIEAVTNQDVTFSFGSPALWRSVADYCSQKSIKLKGLRKVLMAGAPVSADLHQKVKSIIADDGETMVPYGATESLPIATFTGTEMLNETGARTNEGKGYCVGYPLNNITIKIINAVDQEIEEWHDAEELPVDAIGEIVVHGNVVTPSYNNLEKQTRMAKIKHSDGSLWHRMGDVGYCDEKGRIWFCGRKGHRVITEKRIYYPVCCEAIFNTHPNVFRTAIVGYGDTVAERKPVLIVEPLKGLMPKNELERQQFIAELKELGQKQEFTSEIELFLFHPSFPVDIRHNAKIFREKLTIWAAGKVK